MTEQQLPLPDNLSQPSQRAFADAGYTHLAQFATVTEAEILHLHGVGPKTIRQLRQALAEHGLAFAGTPSERAC